MQYKLYKDLCGDFNVFEVNKLKPRSYFIPYPTKDEANSVSLLEKRYKSPYVKVLNGMWDFAYFDNPNNLSETIDTASMKFDKLDVPSCWQFRGYGKPAYINLRYPFKYNPPKIPTTEPVKEYFSLFDGFKHAPEGEYNHAGVYRTFFDVENTSKRYILSFLGVMSCIEVQVNGKFVGYSEESHNTAEFDITSLVREGKNEIVCVVRRWCNGTYLECQDMFRNTGIFRDVLLRISNPSDIWDIDFKTTKNEETGLYSAEITVETTGELEISVTLEESKIIAQKTEKTKENKAIFQFKDIKVIEWNAEKPTLYNLFIETKDTCIKQRVGFKTVKIDGRLFLVNGHKIKFHGVNHHDTNPKNGYVMTPQDIDKDLKLCKQFNIDMVRTSHYAPDPLLIELAAEYGLYIVDEVDLETHGVQVQKLPPSMNWLSNNPAWKTHYVDRAVRHYNRDKLLATPIVMWSLGNESGDGCNTFAMYQYFKSVTSIPVHYESVVHAKRKAYDVASQMYPSVEEVKAAGEGTSKTKQFNDRPYFLCEYAHAMGVGPGNIEGYWQQFYKYDSLIGGCVWEMVDHAVLHEDGSYTYGGDHGEWIHDSNFCVDGLFYPDRRPSTGAYLVRHTYRPIRVSRLQGNEFEIFNTTAFTNGKEFKLLIKIDNQEAFEYIPEVQPLQKIRVNFEVGEGNYILFTTYNQKGLEVGQEQIQLKVPSLPCPKLETTFPEGFDVLNGKVSFNFGDYTMVSGNPYTILFRASTDNDKHLLKANLMKKWYKEVLEHIEQGNSNKSPCIAMTSIEAAGNRFLNVDTYEACQVPEGFDGAVLVSSLLHPVSAKGYLPRFGKTFKLDASFSRVRWFGRSLESYEDMKEQSPVCLNERTVKEMTEPNIRPQESGNRCDTTFVELSNDNILVRFDAVDKPFNLGIKPYSDLELTEMKHQKDEITTGTYVTLSAFQQGIGTGSCGPYTLKEHCFKAKQDYEIKFVVSWKKLK